MRRHTLIILSLLAVIPAFPQIRLEGYNDAMINPELYSGQWPASWISVPGESADGYGVYHFRRSFDLAAVPENFVIHISADNRYKLFVNGPQVSDGPARCDAFNWNFETLDIAPYLVAGMNTLAAVVWNFGEKRPLAQESFGQTGLIVQGDSSHEAVVNTNPEWVCYTDKSYSPWETPVYGYYVCGPGELVDTRLYPWGWEQSGYDESEWKPAMPGLRGAMKGGADYFGRLLVPRPIPAMESHPERLFATRVAENLNIPEGFPAARWSFTVPAGTRARLVLDNGVLTTGYPVLEWSGGCGARITMGYTEAFYEKEHSMDKGNRNEVEGKIFAGYEDVVIADGGTGRIYSPLWWRTWRYLDIRIETADRPLVIKDISFLFSGYPFLRESGFDAPEWPELAQILDTGWRTARLCANETYMDCPYYEQLQYFGDTRIQAMVTLYNTRDDRMVMNALEQGRQSMVADGLTMSRYPTRIHQFISSFSLWWICMGHDYWIYRGGEKYLATLLPAYRSVLSWYEQWLKPEGNLAYVPYWFFADWADGFVRGEPNREKYGDSAFQDLLYIIALEAAAEMERAFGLSVMADHYEMLVSDIRAGLRERYWSKDRGLFADTPALDKYSQHVNSLAVLAGAVTGDEARRIMEKTLAGEDMIKTTIYFTYYLNRALAVAGLGDKLLDNLGIWEEQMALGLTTWAESPEPSRSDCHAWGSSPNIEFFRTVLGVDSAAPGFRKVRIAPALGKLKQASGTIPHPQGTVGVDYSIDKKGRLTAHIVLPGNVSGTFIWKGREYPLHENEQTLKL